MAKAASQESVYLKLVMPKDDTINYSKILGKKSTHKRSTIKIKEDKKLLAIEIESNDITALRASANSILRNLQVIKATKIK